LKKLLKTKAICKVCNKIFEYEYDPDKENPIRDICSDKCREIFYQQLYQKRLLVMPKKFRSIDCDNRNMVIQGRDHSLFITGRPGVGKTVLMAGIVKELLKKNNNKVKWISYPEFIMTLQSQFKKENGSPYDMAESIADFEGTLCIDDIGAEKMTAFVQQITYYVINHREQEMLHTVITSNYSLQEIDNQIDERVSSRIAGMCKIIKMTGKDRRLENDNKREVKI